MFQTKQHTDAHGRGLCWGGSRAPGCSQPLDTADRGSRALAPGDEAGAEGGPVGRKVGASRWGNTSVPGVPNTRRSEGMRGARAGRPHKQEGDTEAALIPLGESCPLTLGPDL